MIYLNLEKMEHLDRLKEKFELLEKEARNAFKQEHLSAAHKEKFNQANEAYKKAHKEWQEYLFEHSDELLPKKL